MECCHQMPPLFDQHRVTFILCQNPYIGTGAPDDGCANEDGFYVAGASSLLKIIARLDIGDTAIDLPAVSIALNREIDHAETFLRRILHFFGEKYGSCASSKNRLLLRKLPQWFFEIHEIEELEHGCALRSEEN